MKLSLATRIFLGYAVVLVTFGAVSLFSVAELHRNQQEIRLVSQGYLQLSQDAAALETFHTNQDKDTERLLDEQSVETRRALIRAGAPVLSRADVPAPGHRARQGPGDSHLRARPARCPSSTIWRSASASWRRSTPPTAARSRPSSPRWPTENAGPGPGR